MTRFAVIGTGDFILARDEVEAVRFGQIHYRIKGLCASGLVELRNGESADTYRQREDESDADFWARTGLR